MDDDNIMRSFELINRTRVVILLILVLISSGSGHAQGRTLDDDFDKGLKFYEAGQLDKAVEAFKQSIKRDRTNADAYYYLANSYFGMSRNQDAVKAYKQAVELNPAHLLAHNNLGTTYHRLGDFKAAVSSYEEALRIKPDYPEAIFGLGVAYLELKNKDAAMEQHKRLAAIDMERADRLFGYINNKISLPVVNNKAVTLVAPIYPFVARGAHASGQVNVWVLIDETGRVISASAVSGHPLLRAAALQAAKLSRFLPTTVNGQPIRVTGIIKYNFSAQ